MEEHGNFSDTDKHSRIFRYTITFKTETIIQGLVKQQIISNMTFKIQLQSVLQINYGEEGNFGQRLYFQNNINSYWETGVVKFMHIKIMIRIKLSLQ